MYDFTVYFYGETENVYNLIYTGSFEGLQEKIIEALTFLNRSSTENHHVKKYHIFSKVIC